MRKKPVTMKRTFGGKVYYYETGADTKTEAKRKADRMRGRGKLVRTVSTKTVSGRPLYLLYSRYEYE